MVKPHYGSLLSVLTPPAGKEVTPRTKSCGRVLTSVEELKTIDEKERLKKNKKRNVSKELNKRKMRKQSRQRKRLKQRNLGGLAKQNVPVAPVKERQGGVKEMCQKVTKLRE